MRFLFALVIILLPALGSAQSQNELDLVRSVLTELQPKSIRLNREFCGWIGKTRKGHLKVSDIRKGTRYKCKFNANNRTLKFIASFHTHAGYDRKYDSEVPSAADMKNARLRGGRSYVSTPGGRFWVIDASRAEARLICGPECLPHDEKHQENTKRRVKTRYNADEISKRQGQIPHTFRLCDGSLCVD